MKKYNRFQAFTLIEILISMTIFAIMMVSVMMIYIIASDISKKFDINREMRNNIKSVVEDIAEEVRKNDIVGVKSDYYGKFSFDSTGSKGNRLKLNNGVEYRLVKYNKGAGILYDNLTYSEKKWLSSGDNCILVKDMCRIVKFKKNDPLSSPVEIGPLTNSKVSFTNLEFAVSGSGAIPKVTLTFTARAAVREGIRSELAEKTKLIFQTTISERALKVK